jgi:dihydroorotate dehydrogenase electron transfer subunit
MVAPAPGQFYMLEVSGGYDPLLRRPFSLYRMIPGGFQILYRIKGKGTSLLSAMKEDTELDFLGPLGNFYPLPAEGEFPVVVAGGIGIASVHSLIEKLSGRAYVVYGAKIEDELFMMSELEKDSKDLLLCTEDGSCGKKGTVIDVLEHLMAGISGYRERPVIYSCGPIPMLRAMAGFASGKGVRAYVSLEEHMACGIGACLGCVVRTVSGYKRVCREGPVFDAGEVLW